MAMRRKCVGVAAAALVLAGCDGEEPTPPGGTDAGTADSGTESIGTGTLTGQLAFTPASVLFARVETNHAVVLYTDVPVTCAVVRDRNALPAPSKSVTFHLYSANGDFSGAESIKERFPYYSERLADGGTGLGSEGTEAQSLTITQADGTRYAGSFTGSDMLNGSGARAYGTLSGTFDARVCP